MSGTAGSPVRHSTTEVLVVGAGPTGLLLAAELARRGVACRIVEQGAARRTAPKAINLHTRTLEVLDDLGIADQALALGHRVHRLNSYSVPGEPTRRARQVMRVDLTMLDSRFPFTLTLAQPETERLIEQRCTELGVQVEWGTRFAGLSQDGRSVVARLERPGGQGTEAVQVAWLVGCDGIDSTVRTTIGVPFEGSRYPCDLICADVRIGWERPHDEAHVFLAKNGTVRCMPMPGPGRWRIVADVPSEPGAGSRGGTGKTNNLLDELQSLVHARGMSVALSDLTWGSRFNIYRYFAPAYRVGRVILAGDAAHVHSPLGAQGMNIGLQDSYNLAWKLQLVLQGASRPELLDSYEEERRAIANGVLRRTDRNTRLIGAQGALAQSARNTSARILLQLPPVQQRLGRTGAQLAMNYRNSRLVRDDAGPVRRKLSRGPSAGDRAPDTEFGPSGGRLRCHDMLQGTGHVLLFFQGKSIGKTPAPAALLQATQEAGVCHDGTLRLLTISAGQAQRPATADGVTVVPDPGGELHRCWHAAAGSLYLVRPDGYVGYRTTSADTSGLSRYLTTIFQRT